MKEIVIWILLAISHSGSNYGNTTVIERFNTEQSCQESKENTFQAVKATDSYLHNRVLFICVKASDVYKGNRND